MAIAMSFQPDFPFRLIEDDFALFVVIFHSESYGTHFHKPSTARCSLLLRAPVEGCNKRSDYPTHLSRMIRPEPIIYKKCRAEMSPWQKCDRLSHFSLFFFFFPLLFRFNIGFLCDFFERLMHEKWDFSKGLFGVLCAKIAHNTFESLPMRSIMEHMRFSLTWYIFPSSAVVAFFATTKF